MLLEVSVTLAEDDAAVVVIKIEMEQSKQNRGEQWKTGKQGRRKERRIMENGKAGEKEGEIGCKWLRTDERGCEQMKVEICK